MIEQMKRQDTKSLIIDLRGNSGGTTAVIVSFLYEMYGDNYFGRNDDAEFVKVKSELYLEKTYGLPPNHYYCIRAGGARDGLRSLRGRGAIAARRRGSPQTRSCSCTT